MGNLISGSVIALVVALGAYFAFRGDEEVIATPTPEPTVAATQTPAPADTPEATEAPTEAPTEVPTETPEPSPTVEAGRVIEPAPIESVEVVVQRSLPPQYVVMIVATLPTGCDEPHTQDVTREGDTFTITILNSTPEGDAICTLILRTYEVNVNLGASFDAGTTYTVVVNGEETTFTAR